MHHNFETDIMVSKNHQLSTAEVIQNAAEIFHNLRWKHGIVVCPYCGSIHIKEYNGYKYKCNDCKNRFSDKTNTLMHGSKLPVSIWMQAIYELSVDNLISSVVLAVKLGINQKSAWLLRTKINYSLEQDKTILEGVVAQDEMYVGGSLSNYHYSRKWDLLRKGNYIEGNEKRYSKQALFALNSDLKQPVFGMTNGEKVVLYATPNPIKKEYIQQLYKSHARGGIVVSDESKLYLGWEKATGSELHCNNHHNNQYKTEEGYTSNAIENKFSWFKRGFTGRITHCKYHQFYLNEFCFRYNTRGLSTEERFEAVISSTIGKHITYRQIKEYKPFSQFTIKEKNLFSIEEIKKILSYGGVQSIEQDGRIYTVEGMREGRF